MPALSPRPAEHGTPPWHGPSLRQDQDAEALEPTVRALIETLEQAGYDVIRVSRDPDCELLVTVGLASSTGHQARAVIAEKPQRPHAGMHPMAAVPLTAREQDVAALIGAGLSYGDIANRLGVTLHTIRRHTERIFAKYGVHSRALLMTRLSR